MRYSHEAFQAFVEAVAHGSFSSAARSLRKSQSAISMAIANLEEDFGLILFDRTSRYPVLTPAGNKVLGQVKEVLAAADRLEELTLRLAAETKSEDRLTIVISDVYQLNPNHQLMHRFEKCYPLIELECLDAEGNDVLSLLQSGRAHLGLLTTQVNYPQDIIVARLPERVEMALYVGRKHPLAQLKNVNETHLARYRNLYLNTHLGCEIKPHGNVWSASDYFMILEMAEEGFGWAELPRSLVKQYGRGRLVELKMKTWPRHISSDVAWSKLHPPGPAGFWLLDELLKDNSL
jgi:DNA-binding transcriptional LysR family regulator